MISSDLVVEESEDEDPLFDIIGKPVKRRKKKGNKKGKGKRKRTDSDKERRAEKKA